jgi:hypothetical protein
MKKISKSDVCGIGFCLGSMLMLGVFAITSVVGWWIQKLILNF